MRLNFRSYSWSPCPEMKCFNDDDSLGMKFSLIVIRVNKSITKHYPLLISTHLLTGQLLWIIRLSEDLWITNKINIDLYFLFFLNLYFKKTGIIIEGFAVACRVDWWCYSDQHDAETAGFLAATIWSFSWSLIKGMADIAALALIETLIRECQSLLYICCCYSTAANKNMTVVV